MKSVLLWNDVKLELVENEIATVNELRRVLYSDAVLEHLDGHVSRQIVGNLANNFRLVPANSGVRGPKLTVDIRPVE